MKKKKNITYDTEAKELDFVKERPTTYYVAGAAVQSGWMAIPLNLMDAFDKIRIINKGVSKHYLEAFKKFAMLDYKSLANILSVTKATLINKKKDQTFNQQVSERIITLADLYSYGYEVFGDRDAFNHWVQVPNEALGGAVPLDMLNNYYGREEVKSLIGRIAYGVYS